MPYNIFIVDIMDVLDNNKRVKVKSILDGYFGKVFAQRPTLTKEFGAPLCSFSTDPRPTTKEMLCYICPPNKSVVATFVGESGTFTFLESHWGRTQIKRTGAKLLAASEVLARNTDPQTIADLVFHELLHNKAKLDNATLHAKGGLASANVADQKLTAANIELMAGAVESEIEQWLGGIGELNSLKARLKSGDPSAGLF